jgi:ring-1,2-phenylacetyl-CoA epoxidase subunit PaaC
VSATTAATASPVERAEQLPEEARAALRDLLLTLADGKRLLGIRYADWMLGAPTLESGIAASSMAQDEWGHARLTYALLSDFGDDPKGLEHEREASAYRSPERLDRAFESWAEMIAVAFLLDTAFSVQYNALLESRYVPARNRIQKMLDEERFHFQHAISWARRLIGSEAVHDAFVAHLRSILPVALRWFGGDEPGMQVLVEEGVVRGDAESLRAQFLATVAPLLGEAGVAGAVGLEEREDGSWRFAGEIGAEGWDPVRRRAADGGPDSDTLGRVRGDRNRAFLMD